VAKTHKFKLVIVQWHDSMHHSRPWFSTHDALVRAEESERDHCVTAAYLIHKTKNLYHFASSLNVQDREVVSFGGLFTIPRGCVYSMKKVK
jgi:hypothetical protein